MLNVVLHEPEIPFNTGAIARTCVATGTALHMIRPYGFVLSDKMIRRAGMDYWPKVKLSEYVDFEDFLQKHPEVDAGGPYTAVGMDSRPGDEPGGAGQITKGTAAAAGALQHSSSEGRAAVHPKFWYATTKAHRIYSDVHFGPDDYIMFGKESAGIPEEILVAHEENCIRIPMLSEIRSLNLSNSVAIVLYEVLRQNHFEALSGVGNLHHMHWNDEAELDLPDPSTIH